MTSSHFSLFSCALLLLLCAIRGDATCQSPNTTDSLYTTDSGVLLTDNDGAGTAERYSGVNNCSWEISCPDGMHVAVYDIVGETGSPLDNLTVTGGGTHHGTVAYLHYHTVDFPGVVLRGKTAKIRWTTSSETTYRNYGLSLKWKCLATRCTAGNYTVGKQLNGTLFAKQTLSHYTNASGLSAYYLSGERCNWTISCPTGSKVMFRALDKPDYFVSYTTLANISFYRADDSAPLKTVIPRIKSGAFFDGYVFDTDNVTVVFKTNTSVVLLDGSWVVYPPYSSRADRALKFSYSCQPSMCSSANSTASTIVADNGTLVTDTDGKGPEPFYRGDNCTWMVSCPDADTMSISYRVELLRAAGDYEHPHALVGIQKGNTTSRTPILKHEFSTYGKEAGVVNGSTMGFSFVTRQGAYDFYGGATFSWKCNVNQCVSPSGSPVSYTQVRSLIHSTFDAVCDWRILCPTADYHYITLRANFSSPAGYFYPMNVSNAATREVLKVLQTNEGVPVKLWTTDLQLSFDSGNPLLATEYAQPAGWTLLYECGGRCSNPTDRTNYTMSNGTIQSWDAPGSATGCFWDISCPAGNRAIRIDLLFYVRWITAEIEVVNNHNSSDICTPLSNRKTTAIMNTPSVRVFYTNGPHSVFAPGWSVFQLNYTCTASSATGISESGSKAASDSASNNATRESTGSSEATSEESTGSGGSQLSLSGSGGSDYDSTSGAASGHYSLLSSSTFFFIVALVAAVDCLFC